MPSMAATAFTQAVLPNIESQAEIHLLVQSFTYVDLLSWFFFHFTFFSFYKMQWLVLWFEGEDVREEGQF